MITIITEPSLDKIYHFKQVIKKKLKRLLNKDIPKYAGHYGVVRSLLDGFEKIGFNYNYNPTNISKCYEHVHVLAGVNTLKMAIDLKQKGKIKRLTAGPNIVISASDSSKIITNNAIDMVIVPSDWVKNFYELNENKLKNRIKVWPAGVDENAWDIKKTYSEPTAIFFKKRPEYNIYNKCIQIAQNQGYNVIEIICGEYSHKELKKELQKAQLVVYFVEQESQGIALQEIWATDTPTFVWNPKIWMYKNVNYLCNSAPYLTDSTGSFFKSDSEFSQLIQEFNHTNFEPRNWVLNNMTDVICAKKFISTTSNFN